MIKLIAAILVAYAGWLIWRGPFYKVRRQWAAPPPAPPAPPIDLDVARACEVLGVEAGATEADIRSAHRRLVARVHPDHGGSEALTREVNWARDLLLGHRRD